MNGKASRRIRRAALAATHSERPIGSFAKARRQWLKQLKREYRAQPYHQRDTASLYGYRSLSHREQEARWRNR
jgi:hypothetical protein